MFPLLFFRLTVALKRLLVPPLLRMLAPAERNTHLLRVQPLVRAHLPAKGPKNLVEFQITLLQSH